MTLLGFGVVWFPSWRVNPGSTVSPHDQALIGWAIRRWYANEAWRALKRREWDTVYSFGQPAVRLNHIQFTFESPDAVMLEVGRTRPDRVQTDVTMSAYREGDHWVVGGAAW